MNTSSSSSSSDEAILLQRAAQLAQPLDHDQSIDSLSILTFRLASEIYGFEAKWVREVLPLHEITHIHSLPSFYAGLINVRGSIIPVVHLKNLLDIEEKGLINATKVLILEVHGFMIGVLAETVESIQEISRPSEKHISDFKDTHHTYDSRFQYVLPHLILVDVEIVFSEEVLAIGKVSRYSS